MKKIIAIFLSICIGLSCCNVVFAGETNKDKAVEMGLLKALGIIEDIPDEVEGSKELSRAEFAVLTAKIMGVEFVDKDTRYFADVPTDHWAVSGINGLAVRGVISFTQDNYFRPNDKITVNEAVKMLVCACGYGDYAMCLANYPQGYNAVASRLNFSVTGSNENLTKAKAYELVYDALHAPLYEGTTYYTEYIKYGSGGGTLLEHTFDVYLYEGVITQAKGICIYGETATSFDDIAIEDIVCIYDNIYKSDVDLYNYLGRKTKIYYYQETEDDIPQIIYIEENKKSDDVTDVLADDIYSVEKGVIKYYVGSRIREISIPASAIVVKNGESLKERSDDDFDIAKGDVRIIDIEDDGTVDVVIISEYENIVADSILTEDGIIYDKIIRGRNVILDDERIVFITDANGTQKSITDIKNGDCISVYESKEYVRAVINEAGITADIYSIAQDDGRIKLELGKSDLDRAWYKIDEVFHDEYLLGKYYTDSEGNIKYTGDIDLRPGKTITYYKDIAGKIAYISVDVSSEWKYGYLVSHMDDGVFEKNIILKIFEQSATMKKYTCHRKVKVDGEPKKSYEEIKAALTKKSTLVSGEDKINGQLIRYKLNNEGYISELDTANVNSEAEGRLSLNHTGKGENLQFWYHTSSFPGGKFFYSGNTIKFVVPEPENLLKASDDDFYIMQGDFADINYTFDTYRLDIKGVNEDVFVIYGTSAITKRGPYLVEEIYQVFDAENGEALYKADLYNMTNCDKVSVSAKKGYDFSFTGKNSSNQDELYPLETGDIAMMNVDLNGKVESVIVYYDYSRKDDESYKVQTGWKTTTNPRQSETTDLLYANVKDIRDGVYRFVYGEELTEEELYEENYTRQSWATRSDLTKTLIVGDRLITEGTAANILPAVVTGTANARKYWFTVKLGRVKSAVIYE